MRLFLVGILLLGLVGCQRSLHDLNTVIKKQPAPEIASK
jgi:Tfp pilus assembly protein PilP